MASPSPLFIFIFCFTMHSCISSEARNLRPPGDDAKSLRGCQNIPCRRIIGAEFDSRTRSGREAAADHKTMQNEVFGEGNRSQVINSDLNDHQDIAVMDYHPPRRNSPIHNR